MGKRTSPNLRTELSSHERALSPFMRMRAMTVPMSSRATKARNRTSFLTVENSASIDSVPSTNLWSVKSPVEIPDGTLLDTLRQVSLPCNHLTCHLGTHQRGTHRRSRCGREVLLKSSRRCNRQTVYVPTSTTTLPSGVWRAVSPYAKTPFQ